MRLKLTKTQFKEHLLAGYHLSTNGVTFFYSRADLNNPSDSWERRTIPGFMCFTQDPEYNMTGPERINGFWDYVANGYKYYDVVRITTLYKRQPQ